MTAEQIGPYRLEQRPEVFPVGTDSLLLGEFARVKRGETVCDLGCGSGVLLLKLAARAEGVRLLGVDLNPAAAALAAENLRTNGLSGQIRQGDLREIRRLFPAGCARRVVSNPPYREPASGGTAPGARGLARSREAGAMEDVCRSAAWLLPNGGTFSLCLPPEQLPQAMGLMKLNGLEPKRLQLVQHRRNKAPFLALLEGKKQGRPGLEVLPVLLLTERETE